MDKKKYDFTPNEISYYKKGLALQREIYKSANLDNNFSLMVSALENIKSEIKARADEVKINRVSKIIKWYNELDIIYRKKTRNGYVIKLPQNIKTKIKHNLSIAYELLIIEMQSLGLL